MLNLSREFFPPGSNTIPIDNLAIQFGIWLWQLQESNAASLVGLIQDGASPSIADLSVYYQVRPHELLTSISQLSLAQDLSQTPPALITNYHYDVATVSTNLPALLPYQAGIKPRAITFGNLELAQAFNAKAEPYTKMIQGAQFDLAIPLVTLLQAELPEINAFGPRYQPHQGSLLMWVYHLYRPDHYGRPPRPHLVYAASGEISVQDPERLLNEAMAQINRPHEPTLINQGHAGKVNRSPRYPETRSGEHDEL